MERSSILPRLNFLIRLRGLLHRNIFGQCHNTLQNGVVFFESLQIKLGQFDTGHLAPSNQLAQLRDTHESERILVRRFLDPGNAKDIRAPLMFNGGMHGRRPRLEQKRRCHITGEFKFANVRSPIDIPSQRLRYLLPLVVGQLDPRNPLCLRNHFRRDLTRLFRLGDNRTLKN